MRLNSFEILVVGRDGHVFPETKLGDRHYIRASPGKEYVVKVLAHRDADGKFPSERYIVALLIDGNIISSKRLQPVRTPYNSSAEVTFHGFVVSETIGRAFSFAIPHAFTVNEAATVVSPQVGSIKVLLYAAEETDTLCASLPRFFSPPKEAHKAIEDKKFWQLPSLETAAGQSFPVNRTPSQLVWNRLRNVPDATQELWYHNDDTLSCIQDFLFKPSAVSTPASTPAATPSNSAHASRKRSHECDTPRTPLIVDLTQEEDEAEVRLCKEINKCMVSPVNAAIVSTRRKRHAKGTEWQRSKSLRTVCFGLRVRIFHRKYFSSICSYPFIMDCLVPTKYESIIRVICSLHLYHL